MGQKKMPATKNTRAKTASLFIFDLLSFFWNLATENAPQKYVPSQVRLVKKKSKIRSHNLLDKKSKPDFQRLVAFVRHIPIFDMQTIFMQLIYPLPCSI